METSLPVPEGVNEDELVDGPKVVHLSSGKATFLAPDQITKPIPPVIGQAAAPVAGFPQATLPAWHGEAMTPPTGDIPVALLKSEYAEAIELALDVLSARLLGLIALLTACALWSFVVYDPEYRRIIAAGVFSAVVFLPMMAIYWRAGTPGEKGS